MAKPEHNEKVQADDTHSITEWPPDRFKGTHGGRFVDLDVSVPAVFRLQLAPRWAGRQNPGNITVRFKLEG